MNQNLVENICINSENLTTSERSQQIPLCCPYHAGHATPEVFQKKKHAADPKKVSIV
jgi:hypothetical protein